MAPPPSPPSGGTTRPSARSGPTAPEISTRSARRSKIGAISNGGNDVSHVVRVKVLGLAGITVDRAKCRTSLEKTKGNLPAPPSKMRAVVTFSRNTDIRAMTTLSKPLSRSPSDDVVVEASEPSNAGGKNQRDDDSATCATHASDWTRPQRHVAVWTSDDITTLGSTVSFEAGLSRSDKDGGAKNTAASSAFAPKSFELTIALTEDDGKESKIALPLGVSSLAVTGDECSDGKSITIDLPVLSLSQARPLASINGLGSYPMIAITSKRQDSDQLGAENTQRVEEKKKRKGLQRLFKRNPNDSNAPKVPSVARRNAFASAYSMDAGGDAILRVSLEVYEKGSDIEKLFQYRRRMAQQRARHISIASNKPRSARKALPRPLEHSDVSVETPEEELDRIVSSSMSQSALGSRTQDEKSSYTGDSADYTGNTTDGTEEATDNAGSLLEDDFSVDESVVAAQDGDVAFINWSNSLASTSDETDDYTLSFTKKDKPLEQEPREERQSWLEIIGRKMPIPVCGTLASMKDVDTEDDTIFTLDGRSLEANSTWNEDLTHVTADFFGRSYQIPVCSAIAPTRDENDTVTALTDVTGRRDPRIVKFLDGLCRGQEFENDFDLASTFSTVSDEEHETIRGLYLSTLAKLKCNRPQPDPKLKETTCADNDESLVSQQYPNDEESAETCSDTYESTPSTYFDPDGEPFQKSSKGSPKGVADFTQDNLTKGDHAATWDTLRKTKHDNIVWTRSKLNMNDNIHEDPFEQLVPPVVIPSNTDVMSVGELTMNTREHKDASEASMLERYRRKFNDQQKETRKGISARSLVPVAFGGDGMCPHIRVITKSSTPIRCDSKDASNSIVEGGQVSQENYFAEYDEISNFVPVATSDKASATQKQPEGGSPHSLSLTGHPSSTQHQDIYSESHPVYTTMTGLRSGPGSRDMAASF